ncbi:hypothetical protein llap_9750 [Limosa lapponica baueri]|uniref:Uncharacterized protein n=1 Tax=Limosa lapponica baueri TaxID=1758121 RepID=A0A2I0U1N9_LIMLA|nr:hypothetical protein llap_9750 [Limosa lapponica baueri]
MITIRLTVSSVASLPCRPDQVIVSRPNGYHFGLPKPKRQTQETSPGEDEFRSLAKPLAAALPCKDTKSRLQWDRRRRASRNVTALWQTCRHRTRGVEIASRTYPEFLLLFCKLEAKGNVSNSSKGDYSKKADPDGQSGEEETFEISPPHYDTDREWASKSHPGHGPHSDLAKRSAQMLELRCSVAAAVTGKNTAKKGENRGKREEEEEEEEEGDPVADNTPVMMETPQVCSEHDWDLTGVLVDTNTNKHKNTTTAPVKEEETNSKVEELPGHKPIAAAFLLSYRNFSMKTPNLDYDCTQPNTDSQNHSDWKRYWETI